MMPQPSGIGLSSCSPACRRRWIITSNPTASAPKTYTLTAIDLPGIKKLRVTYRYPKWSGMKDAVEEPGGDLRAIEGTEASRDPDR